MHGSELGAQIRAELEQIMPLVSRFTGLPTRWSGKVEMIEDAGFLGQKRFSCDILISAAVAGQPERWSTLIHEALHSVSAGYVRSDFLAIPGWEEGVIECLQRRMRPDILAELGIALPPSFFVFRETGHPYNAYIAALERIRLVLPVTREQFYVRLLATPIADRPVSVLDQIRRLPPEEQRGALMTFSASGATLKRRL